MDSGSVHPSRETVARRAGPEARPAPGDVRVDERDDLRDDALRSYEAAWGDLFRGTEPAELVELVTRDDPFGLVEQTALRLRQLALLLDVDQVHARVVARAAYEGARSSESPGLQHVETRLNHWIDLSAAELVAEDREELRRGGASYPQWDPRYMFLTQVLGVPASRTRRACVAFNGLGREVRRSFFAITIEGLSVEVSAQREGFAPEVLQDRVLTCFGALLGAKPTPCTRPEAAPAASGTSFVDPAVLCALGALGAPGAPGDLGEGGSAELFSTSDPRLLAGVTGLVDSAGIRTPAGPVVERHLVRALRHEVARLLRQAAVAHLFDDPETARWLHRNVNLRDRHRPLALEALGERAQELRARASLFAAYTAETDLLDHATRRPGRDSLVADLALASHRLVGGEAARVDLAFDRLARGDFDLAETLLGEVLATGPADIVDSVARENLGLLHLRRGDPATALDHYRAATRTSELRPGAAIGWLHAAAAAEDGGELLEAAAALDGLVAPDHVAVIERCDLAAPGAGTPVRSEARDLVESLRHRMGRTSLTVTDLYFSDRPAALAFAATVCPVT